MDGVIRFASPADNKLRVTFDDKKTDRGKITEALVNGDVVISGESAPPQPHKPPSYQK
jgi:hypothetical protein